MTARKFGSTRKLKGESYQSLIERKSERVTETGCQLWTGGGVDYGRIGIGEKLILAHRLSWEIYKGPIANGLFVLHRCDVPCCINVNHLYLGTQKENAIDRVTRNRGNIPVGIKNPAAKLTENDVLRIRSDTRTPYKVIAKEYGVTDVLIGKIKLRRVWKHI